MAYIGMMYNDGNAVRENVSLTDVSFFLNLEVKFEISFKIIFREFYLVLTKWPGRLWLTRLLVVCLLPWL